MKGREFGFEDEKQFIATTYIDLTRHGSRYGGPMDIRFYDGSVKKFDDSTNLTLEGKQQAQEFGALSYPAEMTLVHPRGGDEPRHGETGEDILKGSGAYGVSRLVKGLNVAPVRDKSGRVKGSRRGKGVDYASAGMSGELKAVRALINEELNRLVSELSVEEQDRLKTDPEMRAKLREQAQILGLKEAMKNEGLVQLAAENEAFELLHALQLSRRGVKAGETKAIPIVGSAIFAESLYKYALVVEDPSTSERKVGFEDVDEIGGFTKQATAFRIKLTRDTRLGDPRNLNDFEEDTKIECEFTDPERAKLFEGKKSYLDWAKVRELAEAAQKRFGR